jgi:hypothetical protein
VLDIAMFFRILTSNQADIEDIITHLGGIKGLFEIAPDIFRIWKTVTAHAEAASQAGQDPKLALLNLARRLEAPDEV